MAKRVSTDEKLDKILAMFKQTPEIYSLKDLEKKISKECGISTMIIPDLLKKLQDEDLISVEKCGTSNVYWCFPYSKHHSYSCDTEKAILSIEGYKEEIEKKKKQIGDINKLIDDPEREGLIKVYNELKKRILEIEEEKKHQEVCSIEEYNKFIKEIEEMKKQINKTTDDIFTIQGYAVGKFGIGRKDFNKNFGVNDEMDYI